jgi:hydroxyethylthiazole kinase-like sugar kinase family protein
MLEGTDAQSLSPGCVVALTGKEDWVSDGEKVVKLSNGHEYVSICVLCVIFF